MTETTSSSYAYYRMDLKKVKKGHAKNVAALKELHKKGVDGVKSECLLAVAGLREMVATLTKYSEVKEQALKELHQKEMDGVKSECLLAVAALQEKATALKKDNEAKDKALDDVQCESLFEVAALHEKAAALTKNNDAKDKALAKSWQDMADLQQLNEKTLSETKRDSMEAASELQKKMSILMQQVEALTELACAHVQVVVSLKQQHKMELLKCKTELTKARPSQWTRQKIAELQLQLRKQESDTADARSASYENLQAAAAREKALSLELAALQKRTQQSSLTRIDSRFHATPTLRVRSPTVMAPTLGTTKPEDHRDGRILGDCGPGRLARSLKRQFLKHLARETNDAQTK